MLASNCLLNRDRFSPCSKYPMCIVMIYVCVCVFQFVYRKKFCSNFNKYKRDIRYLCNTRPLLLDKSIKNYCIYDVYLYGYIITLI